MMTSHERPFPCLRRPLGSHRTRVAQGADEAEGWSPSDLRSCRARRHLLPPPYGLPVADAAESVGLWQQCNLLAAAARLAGSRVPAVERRTRESRGDVALSSP